MQLHTTPLNTIRFPYLLGLALAVGLFLSWSGSNELLFGSAQPGTASSGQLAGTSSTANEGPTLKGAGDVKTATQTWATPQDATNGKLTVERPENLPAGLYNVWLALQQVEGDSSYNLSQGAGEVGVGAIDSSWQATNSAQNFKLEFGSEQVKVNGWSISLNSFGAKSAVTPEVEANRVVYQHSNGLTEWYMNLPFGLEQGFTLAQALPQTAEDGWLDLPVSFEGASVAASSRSKDWLKLLGSGGEEVGQYGKLYVTDANGKVLESELSSSEDGTQAVLRLKVADATYPVTIDPFVQQAELTSSDGTANDNFGYSVALSTDGNTALIGAFNKTIGQKLNQGVAYVFIRNGTSWTQQAELIPSDSASYDKSGYSVALSSDGNTALIGSYTKNIGQNNSQGATYVFTRSGTNWTQQSKFTAPDGAAYNYFGVSVDLSADGNTAIVGAPYKAIGQNSDQGAAYVYVRSGTTWTQQQELTASDGASNDRFGNVALSADGNTALIGAGNKTIGQISSQGAAYVFTRSGTNWTQQSKLIAPDGVSGDFLGISVDLSADGNTALVSANGKTIGQNNIQGAAYIFTRSGITWTQQQKLTATDGASNDLFSSSVALSADGNTALIGADNKTIGQNSGQGAAYIFVRSGTTWTQKQRLTASDGASYDTFGSGVALSSDGNIVLVGAYNKAVNQKSGQGAAYVFVNNTPPSSTTVTLVTSASPVFTGQSLTFTVRVTNPSGGVPTGNITFKDGEDSLTTVALAGGSATYTTATLSITNHPITAVYAGDSNNSTSTSNIVKQQILATGCASLTVTTNSDDNSCGSLRQALAVAHSHAASSGSTVVEISVSGPVKLDGNSAGVTLGLGITLKNQSAGCGASGPNKFIQGGTGPTGDGLILNKASLIGIWVSGFDGRQIVAYGGVGSNMLSCVRVTRTNPV